MTKGTYTIDLCTDHLDSWLYPSALSDKGLLMKIAVCDHCKPVARS